MGFCRQKGIFAAHLAKTGRNWFLPAETSFCRQKWQIVQVGLFNMTKEFEWNYLLVYLLNKYICSTVKALCYKVTQCNSLHRNVNCMTVTSSQWLRMWDFSLGLDQCYVNTGRHLWRAEARLQEAMPLKISQCDIIPLTTAFRVSLRCWINIWGSVASQLWHKLAQITMITGSKNNHSE